MTDTLTVFGNTFTGVTGIKASDNNSQIKTYVRPQGTLSVTQNGTGIDVTNYASVDVNVSGGSQITQDSEDYLVLAKGAQSTMGTSVSGITLDVFGDVFSDVAGIKAYGIDTKNIYNPNTKTDGYYINSSGVITVGSDASISDYIPVTVGSSYVWSGISGMTGNNNKRVVGYKANKSYKAVIKSVAVSGIGVSYTNDFTIPSDVAYIRLSFNTADTEVMVEQGTTKTSYVPPSGLEYRFVIPQFTIEDIAFGQISGDIAINGSGTIVSYAFAMNRDISGVSAPNITQINERAFYECTKIAAASFPSCSNVGGNAFYNCSTLSDLTLSDSNLTIGTNAFQNCAALEDVDFTKLSLINNSTFRDCGTKDCLFNPVQVNDSGLRDAKYFGVGYFPRLTTVNGTFAFGGAYSSTNNAVATVVVAPVLATIASTDAFSYNDLLTAVDIGNLTTVQAKTFEYNTSMNVLILRKSSVTTLANINAFTGTPFASGGAGGTLYVPSALISAYQGATNWSTILVYANNNIQAIEGSVYETKYADGTSIT